MKDDQEKNTYKKMIWIFSIIFIVSFFSLLGVSWWLESSIDKIQEMSLYETKKMLKNLLIIIFFIFPVMGLTYVLVVVFLKKLKKDMEEKLESIKK